MIFLLRGFAGSIKALAQADQSTLLYRLLIFNSSMPVIVDLPPKAAN
tara:strand:+ start:177 stop:317 length:141 start_codon:yes stop_codon:yes gene_type:complete